MSYETPLDFKALADEYPPLKPHVFVNSSGHALINFKDESAQRRLTEAILHRDFNLSLVLPKDRLCPAVPNRLNYVKWIRNIVEATSENPRRARGLDIGTGASAIYPLLACALEPNWTFIATDIDPLSFQYARQNVGNNNLQQRIEVVQVHPGDALFLRLMTLDDHSRFDFTMCNPPFYSSIEDITRSAESKEFAPHAVCTGAEVEMITGGGEVAFVQTMVSESLHLKTRCNWFTSLLGKLSSLAGVIQSLKANEVDNYGVTEFIQGQTKRWGIAWSFGSDRLPDNLARVPNQTIETLLLLTNTLRQTFPESTSVTDVLAKVVEVLSKLEGIRYEVDLEMSINVSASSNSWSRAARRRKVQSSQEPTSASGGPVLLRCQIGGEQPGNRCGLWCRWVKGYDRQAFESFWSHVSRKVLLQCQ